MAKDKKKLNDFKVKNLNSLGRAVIDALMESFPDITILLDEDGNIIKASESAFSYFNFDKSDKALGINIIDLATHDYREDLKKDLERVKLSNNLNMVEYEFFSKNGAKFIGELSLSNFFDQKSKKRYMIGIIRDITNQKIIEIELRENKQMFQLVMDNIPQLISWKDINSNYLGCNKNFARVAGLSDPKEILGKTDYELPWKISEAESFFEIDQLVMDTDKPEYHIIEPQLQADGKQAWLDTNKIPLHNSKEEVVGILCTYEDITERVTSEIALKNSEKKYKEAYNRAEFYKDVFAHDVSNILQVILSSVELCRFNSVNMRDGKDLDNLFDIIVDQVNRGGNLVSNIRKISSIDNIKAKLEKVEICDVLNSSIKEIKNKFPKKQIRITFKTENNMIFVYANHLIADVFKNILYNAIKHNSRTTVKIDIEISKEFYDEESYIKIQFKDNGRGIENSQKLNIFEQSTLEAQSFNRLGLGLSLVKKLLENYNGKIYVEDRVEGDYTLGSNFIILLKEYRDSP